MRSLLSLCLALALSGCAGSAAYRTAVQAPPEQPSLLYLTQAVELDVQGVVQAAAREGLALTVADAEGGWAFGVAGQPVLVQLRSAEPPEASLRLNPWSPKDEELDGVTHALSVHTELGSVDPAAGDAKLLRLLVALAEGTGAVGLRRRFGGGVVDPAFVAAALQGSADSLPFPVAVDLVPAQDDGRGGLVTWGMRRYGREEIWVTTDPQGADDALAFLLRVGEWILAHDPPLQAGETVGREESDERIAVQRASDPLARGFRVLRFDLGALPSS